PFFSTRAQGTGLGLPICRQIMNNHGGSIDLASERGAGTTVTLSIPAESE
ncbi:MAG: ATP-binding protein, partial [Candidatus Krumholzibacteriota bacterium]